MKHVMSGRINRVGLLVIKRWEKRQAFIKLGLKMFSKNRRQKHQVLHLPVHREHHDKMTGSKCFSVLDASVEFGSCSEESGDHLCVCSAFLMYQHLILLRDFYIVPEAFSREIQHMWNSRDCSEV